MSKNKKNLNYLKITLLILPNILNCVMQHHNQPIMSQESHSSQEMGHGNGSPMEPSAERHRATIMALFLNNGPNSHEILRPHTVLPPDFDIDLILDDQGHTALHWAAALSNIQLLSMLLQKVLNGFNTRVPELIV
jgi:ankyrin repeat protein